MFNPFRPKSEQQAAASSEYNDKGISSFQYDRGTKTALLALSLFAGSTLTGCFGAPTMPKTSETPHPEATPSPTPSSELIPDRQRIIDPLDIKSIADAVAKLKEQNPDAAGGAWIIGDGHTQEIRSAQATDKTGKVYLLAEYDFEVEPSYKGFPTPESTGSIGVVFINRAEKYVSVKQYTISAPAVGKKTHFKEFYLTALSATDSLTAEGAIDIQFTANSNLIKGIEDLEKNGSLTQIVKRTSKIGVERTIAGYEITNQKDMDTFLSGGTFSDPDKTGLALASRYMPQGKNPGFASLGASAPTTVEPILE